MSTEVAVRESFALASPEATEILQESLEGATAEDMKDLIETVSVPGSGGTVWQLPGDDPANPENVGEIIGVVIDDYRTDSLYIDAYDGGNNPPDALWVGKQFVYANERAIEKGVLEGRPIDEQPLNEFGTSLKGGQGKAIDNKWRLFIVRSGEFFPLQIEVPVMSREGWFNFRQKRIAGKGKRSTQVLVGLGLKRVENTGGIAYAQIVPRLIGDLDPEQAEHFAKLRQEFAPLTRRVSKPEAGEQTAPEPQVELAADEAVV